MAMWMANWPRTEPMMYGLNMLGWGRSLDSPSTDCDQLLAHCDPETGRSSSHLCPGNG